jgi:hypothetical protein
MTEVSIPDILSILGKSAKQGDRKINMITGDLSEMNIARVNLQACPAKGRKSKDHLCCSQLGKSCSAECDCKGTCNNAFNAAIKNRLFGRSLNFCGRELQPNACFVKWLCKEAQQGPRAHRHGALVANLHFEAKIGYMDTSMRVQEHL